MNEIKIFENTEFGSVRTIAIDGEPYFVGKDVAVQEMLWQSTLMMKIRG